MIASETPSNPDSQHPDRPDEVESVGPLLGLIGRYEVRKVRGSGAHGLVYQAWDPELARWVALKVPQFSTDDEQRIRRFLDEAQTAASLRHPRIVAVFDSGRCLGRPYLASEFVDGQTLAERLAQRRIGRRDAVRIACELAEALYVAHQAAVIHRDVKPSNVMLDRQGHARLMDFGLAKRLDQDSGLTQDGTVLGTPAYLSPEQARGESKQIGPASDQFTLACVLFEMLTGRKPFEGGTFAVVRKIASEPAPTLRSIDPTQDARLETILKRALHPKPDQRYPTIQQFGRELQAWWKSAADSNAAVPQASSPTAAVKAMLPLVGANRAITIGGSAVITLLVVVGLGAARFLNPPQQAAIPASPPISPAESTTAVPVESTVAVLPTQPATPPMPSVDPRPAVEPPAQPDKPPEIVQAGNPPPDVQPKPAAVEPDPLAELTTTETYPAVVDKGADPVRTKQLAELLDTMLTRGLKTPSREVDTKASDGAYAEALKLAPREPRVAYARGLILKKRAKSAEALAQFEQARQLGGYPFLPAYQAIVLHRSAVADYEEAADALLALARDLAAVAGNWPDQATRVKTYFWMGKVAGLHQVRGMIPATTKAIPSQPVFAKRAEELRAAIPAEFLTVYQSGWEETAIAANEALGNADMLDQLRDQQQREVVQLQLQATNNDIAQIEEKKAGIELQVAEKRAILEKSAAAVRAELLALKSQYEQLEIDAAPAVQDLLNAELTLSQLQPPIPNADGTIDPVANEAFLSQQASAAYQRTVAQQRVQGFSARYEQIMRKAQAQANQYARINVEFKKLTGGALAEIEQLNRNSKMAELKKRKVENTAPKELSKQDALRETLKELRKQYLTRDLREEAEWIRRSLAAEDAAPSRSN